MTFGEKLRKERKRKGLTQAELAKQAGLGVRTINAYEQGNTYPKKRGTYDVLARLLGVEADYLKSENEFAEVRTLTGTQILRLTEFYRERIKENPDLDLETYEESKNIARILQEAAKEPEPPRPEPPKPQLSICVAKHSDLPFLLPIYEAAHKTMEDSGNTEQWKYHYPSMRTLIDDIERRQLFVVSADGKPCAAFALILGHEPTYANIENGEWHSTKAYATIHRLASDGTQHGIFDVVLKFCKACCPHLRADTHADNKIMQHLLQRSGFVHCGTIYVWNLAPSPRLAYELLPEHFNDALQN